MYHWGLLGADEDVGKRQESWTDFDGSGKLEKEL